MVLAGGRRQGLRPGGGRRAEGAAAEAAVAALALVTRQPERQDQGPCLESAGGGKGKGKTTSSPLGGCGSRGRQEALSREKLPPPRRRRPVPSARPPTPSHSRSLCHTQPEPNFPLGSELGAGRARRGGPGAAGALRAGRGPAWALLRTRRRRRRRARPRGRGGRAEGGGGGGGVRAGSGR